MTVRYSVNFEFLHQVAVTHRGVVSGTTAGTCMRRAVEAAQAALGKQTWSSMVCVLLERVKEASGSVLVAEPQTNESEVGV